jgi:hypothetical protein
MLPHFNRVKLEESMPEAYIAWWKSNADQAIVAERQPYVYALLRQSSFARCSRGDVDRITGVF